MNYPLHLLKLMETLKRLPGVGTKSAERFAFQMIHWKPEYLEEMGKLISSTSQNLFLCHECGCLTGKEGCAFCASPRELEKMLCIIASPRDAFAIEETGTYHGLYHVLGGLLSPIQGMGPDILHLPRLQKRIQSYGIQEVVIALDSTLEGDTTALYLKRELEPLGLRLSRLAFGLPMGSALDYVDGGTLACALQGRSIF